ncbi:MAG: CBS domain-containing protein [Clostridiales bacterium]|nr:CBS domain-containing protein [Clostridiales bacterium]
MKIKTKLLLLEIVILIVICSLYKRIVIGVIWVILHEFGHLLICRKYKVKINGIMLHLAGVKAEVDNIEELEDKKKIKIYLAGPLVNLIAFGILLVLNKYYYYSWINESLIINIGLFIFNMLPCYPLDGNRIYEVLIGKRILYIRAKNILVKLSFITSGILIFLFLLTVYIHNTNISLLLAAICIIYSTIVEKNKTMYILMRNLFKKRKGLIKNEYVENKNISVFYKSSLVKAMGLLDRNRYNYFFVLNDSFELIGIIYEEELISALKKYGNIMINEYLEKKNNKI